MARASTLGRVCVGQPTPQDGICFSQDHEHEPNPQWLITEDGHPFKVGDRLYNYYDGYWGTVQTEPSEYDGWFWFKQEASSITDHLNSVRVSKYAPKSR